MAERRDDILDRPFRDLGTHRDVAESAVVEDFGPDGQLSSKCTARARKRVHHPCFVNLSQSFSSSFDQFCVFVIPSSFSVLLLCSSKAPRWRGTGHHSAALRGGGGRCLPNAERIGRKSKRIQSPGRTQEHTHLPMAIFALNSRDTAFGGHWVGIARR